jgi:type IV pilus assembly protein PilC
MNESNPGTTAKAIPIKRGAELFRELADLTESGFTASEAVEAIKDDQDFSELSALLDSIGRDLERDPSLAKALERHDSALGRDAVALLGVAEQRNALAGGLALLAGDFERRQQLHARVPVVLLWPLFLIGVLGLLVLLVMIFVIPAYKSVFDSFGAELPVPTQMLLTLSDFVVDYWWIIAAVVVALPFAIAWLRRRSGALDRIWLNLPGVGYVLIRLLTARATAALADAVAHGIPFAPVIAYLQSTLDNKSLKGLVAELGSDVGQGLALSVAWRKQSRLSRRVAKMMEIGERSNKLPSALARLARIHGVRAVNALAVFRQVLFVTAYILTGLIVGLVVIAMYLPIFKLSSVI